MVVNILKSIEVRLGVDYIKHHRAEPDKLAEIVVCTGSIDAYFSYKLSYLEYYSVRLETKLLDKPKLPEQRRFNYVPTVKRCGRVSSSINSLNSARTSR